jgi:hypothetical protein
VVISQVVTIGDQGHIGEAIKDLEDLTDMEEFIDLIQIIGQMQDLTMAIDDLEMVLLI